MTLQFESRFESGNLSQVVKRGDSEYDLYLKADYNTTGFQNWFFFSVENVRAGQVYRLNIVNLQKADSLYSSGMRPLAYSVL